MSGGANPSDVWQLKPPLKYTFNTDFRNINEVMQECKKLFFKKFASWP
jgi:hypothetical protein